MKIGKRPRTLTDDEESDVEVPRGDDFAGDLDGLRDCQ